MIRRIHYGSQIYIEINNLKPLPHTEKRLLCSSGFLQESVHAVKSSNFHHANFRNCLFVVLPGLVDTTEDLHIVQSLRTQLEYLVAYEKEDKGTKDQKEKKEYKSGKHYVNSQLAIKTKHIEQKEKHIKDLNKKIMEEMDNKPVNFADVVLLKHLESGYYLCADFAHHPHDHSLNNLHLKKELSLGCYFKFFSYTSANERGPFYHYESEMKLVSAYTNGIVTMAKSHPENHLEFHNEDDLNRDLDEQGFPKDMARRKEVIQSFDNRNTKDRGIPSADFIVGTTSDSADDNRIRVYNFVTRTELLDYAKRRAIKNGDYVRLHIDEFYLTAYKNPNREHIGLFSQRTENYSYNIVNSIFQVIKAGEVASHVYPVGHEIQTEPKEADDAHLAEGGVFLKHFVTGAYLPAFSDKTDKLEKLFVYDPKRDEEVPWFGLMNSHLKGHAETLTRNSKVNLKIFGKESCLESEIDKDEEFKKVFSHQYNQKDPESGPLGGYSGQQNPEDKIARHLRLGRKAITRKEGFDSFFRVNLVNDEEIQRIQEFESYAASLKKFMFYVLKRIYDENASINLQAELTKIIEHTKKLRELVHSFDMQSQVLCMELKIVDVAAQLIYFFYGGIGASASLKASLNGKEVVSLIKDLTEIIVSAIDGNSIIHSYMSQYVKVFISCLLHFPEVMTKEVDQVKNAVVKLLRRFLSEKDATTLQLFDNYAEKILEKAYKQSDYSTHLLRIMDHNSSSKAVNVTNNLRDTFIKTYLSNDNKRRRILPPLALSSDNQIQIIFETEDSSETVLFHKASSEQLMYMKWVFRLINTIARRQPLRFLIRIIEHYDGTLLLRLIESNRTQLGLKAEILGALRSVHFAYVKLPFNLLDSRIHYLKYEPDHELESMKTDFEQSCIEDLKKDGIDTQKIEQLINMKFDFEKVFVKLLADHLLELFPPASNVTTSDYGTGSLLEVPSPVKPRTPNTANESAIPLLDHSATRNYSYPSAELKPPKKSKTLEDKTIAFLGSTLQLIDDVLQNREDSGLETVCHIKKFLCTLVEEAAKGLQVLESSYGKVFNRYAHKIFKSLVEIDKFVLNLAFKDYLKTHNEIKVKKSPKDDSQEKKKKMKTSKISPAKKLRKATTIVHVQRGLEWIPEGFADLKFLKKWLKKNDKQVQYASIKSLDDGLLRALWRIVKIGDKSLSNAAVMAMESKSSLNKIYQEIYDYTFLSHESEVATLTELMEHLLDLTTIGRRIQVKMGFQIKTKEGQDTIKKIIELFEKILLIIYPFADIIRNEDPSLEPEEAGKQYFKRFRESKLQPQEMPFVMDPKLIKTFYQKVLKIFKAPKILAPFVRFLGKGKNGAFAEFDLLDAKYAYYLLLAILRIFMQDRLDNQLILAELADIIALFHDPQVMKETVEASEMFKELCQNAGIFKRLTGSQDFDFLTSYITNIQTFSFEEKMEYVSLRNLNNVLSLEFAKDMVSPGKIMKKKLLSLLEYLKTEHKLSLAEILRHNEWIVLSGGYDSEREPLYHDNIQLEFPASRIVVKEFLEAESLFAKTASKAEVIKLQKEFKEEQIISLITNRNIEFNFDLKQKVLEFFENLNFKSAHKRTTFFLNYDQFAKFVSLLFVDVQQYLMSNSRDPKLQREFFGHEALGLKNVKDLRNDYSQLPKGKLNNLAFMEYQSQVLFRDVWKDFIYYVLCNLFGTFISNYSGFMKDSQQTYFAESIFKIWFRLLRKLFHVDKLSETEATDKYRMMIQKALKDAAEYAEYAEYRKKLERKMAKMAAEKIETIEKAVLSNAMDIDLAGTNVAGISLKNCDGHEEKDDEYLSKRLKVFYLSLENGDEVIQKLCKLLAAPETARKDKLFLLAFFAQTMQKKKKKKEDKDDKGDQGDQGNMGDTGDKPVETEKMKAEKIEAEKQWAAKVLETQDMLANLGIVDALFEVLLQHEDDKRMFTKVIALSAALLKGGNRRVQDKFYQCFKTDFDNQVFGYITNFLETLFESFLVNEKERTQICYRRALNFVFDYLIKNKLSIGMVVASGNVKEMLEKAYQNEIEKELDSTVMAESASIQKDRKLLKLILKFIHYLCEGHHPEFQEFLRDQALENHTHSYNILEFLLQTYRVYHKHINTHNLDIGIKILEAIIELEQSEIPTNTLMLLNKTFINDICATVNIHHVELDLLSRGFSFDPNAGEFLVLKLKALTILKDLVEKLDLPDLKKMKQYIDLPLLIGPLKENILKFDYDKRQDDKKIRSPKDLEEEDIVNENLSCASMIYIILRHLSFDEREETFSQDIHDAIQELLEGHKEAGIVRRYLNHFFKEYIGTIEIFRPKSTTLVKIYFPTPVMYFYLKDERKNEFCGAVDRSSTQTKITALMDSIDEFKSEMKLEYDPKTLHHRLPLNVNTIFYYMIYLTAFLALTVNVFNVFTLEYNYDTDEVDYKISDRDRRIMLGLNITQSILSFLLLARWLSVQRATYLTAKWSTFVKSNSKKYGPLLPDLVKPTKESYFQFGGIWKNVLRLRKKLRLKGPDSPEWQNEPQDSFLVKAVLMAYNLNFIFRCWEFWSLSIYFGVCVGSNFHPLVTTVQLFDIALKSDVVIRIIRAFLKNIFQFMWTLFLLIIAINTYTMIGMHFLHDRYADGDGGDLCPDAYACFLANLNYGLRNGGGIADSLQGTTYNPHAKWNYYLETFFDLSFFIGMITLLLNLVFGMIIDAFGDLRDEKTFNDDDIANVCFICGLQRSEYERSANFDRHIEEEHNMWQYVAYIVYLLEKQDKDPDELNDIEDYVLNCYKEEGLKSKWIPMGKSLTLQRLSAVPEEEETGEEQEKLKEMLTEVVDKVVKKHNRYLLTKVSKIHAVLSDDESKIFSKKNV